MKALLAICGLILCTTIFSLTIPTHQQKGITQAVMYIKLQSAKFAESAAQLQDAIAAISPKDSSSILQARQALIRCRVQYKSIAFFLEYFFPSSARVYNMPTKREIEEPYMEYEEPTGLQVMEDLLFQSNVAENKAALILQAQLIHSSASDIPSLLFRFNANDQQLLESIRLEFIRIITLGITGWDALYLKSGITEAAASLNAVQQVIDPFLKNKSDSVCIFLHSGIAFLQSNSDFDTFDRMTFLTQYMLPLQGQLSSLISHLQLQINTTGDILNYNARDLFCSDALNVGGFSSFNPYPDSALLLLGKKLFSETALSGNNAISCATCHDPAKHFTDGLSKSKAFDRHTLLLRNAPSLLYAGFQHMQFWDGRAGNLEQQITMVLRDSLEMNGAGITLLSADNHLSPYYGMINTLFKKTDTLSAIDKAAVALAAFVRSLHPRNSRFDQYMQGKSSALNVHEINGFNIFMGKGQCGTCHFAPIFNGLTPPLFDRSELEVLGTTKTDSLDHPQADEDRGRYAIFSIDEYDRGFKTPTVRNVSATAPYMHNGAFTTLESVVEFYNRGGGAGLGLGSGNQSLSAVPLQLTKQESIDIVSFLHALEDSVIIE